MRTMTSIFSPLSLTRGPAWRSRLALAPLTNSQSRADGVLSDDEFTWLTKRAQGGFALTMTCAAHVQACGQGFPGQLGVFGDQHLPGLARLAAGIRAAGSVSAVQLHHAGCRSPRDLVGTPVCPSDNAALGARGLALAEVEQLVEDFVAAAARCERAGFDGVEIHGAHGYILAQFLSADTNRREDRYGGSAANRARIVHEIIAGVRARCRPDFQLGLRLSPERFGVRLADMLELARDVLAGGALDYLDVSLWDVEKAPEEEAFRAGGRSLLSHFAALERGATRLGVAGKVRTPAEASAALAAGADFVLLGRAAILNHNFPLLAAADAAWAPAVPPVTRAHLRREGLGEAFIDYMAESRWGGFVRDGEDEGSK
jgi:2,4-dienoyl-CoA reductase-like NADH-dependent reductase (Old Yellow Enzyme family)